MRITHSNYTIVILPGSSAIGLPVGSILPVSPSSALPLTCSSTARKCLWPLMVCRFARLMSRNGNSLGTALAEKPNLIVTGLTCCIFCKAQVWYIFVYFCLSQFQGPLFYGFEHFWVKLWSCCAVYRVPCPIGAESCEDSQRDSAASQKAITENQDLLGTAFNLWNICVYIYIYIRNNSSDPKYPRVRTNVTVTIVNMLKTQNCIKLLTQISPTITSIKTTCHKAHDLIPSDLFTFRSLKGAARGRAALGGVKDLLKGWGLGTSADGIRKMCGICWEKKKHTNNCYTRKKR